MVYKFRFGKERCIKQINNIQSDRKDSVIPLFGEKRSCLKYTLTLIWVGGVGGKGNFTTLELYSIQ